MLDNDLNNNKTEKYYMVTVARYGFIRVKASSKEEAMDIADHQTTGTVNWSDDWDPTDAMEEKYDPALDYVDSYMFD